MFSPAKFTLLHSIQMPLLSDNVPYSLRVGIHIVVFLFSLVTFGVLTDMIAAPGSIEAAYAHVSFSMMMAIILVALTGQDIGFFFGAMGVLTFGMFRAFPYMHKGATLLSLTGGFGIVVGASMFLTKSMTSPGDISQFFRDY